MEITENGVYNVKGYTYADVNVAGGGESSDFSTAYHIVINNSSGADVIWNLCFCEDDKFGRVLYALPKIDNVFYSEYWFSFGNEVENFAVDLLVTTATPLVYEDIYLNDYNVVTTGGVTYANNVITITGDGTITITEIS